MEFKQEADDLIVKMRQILDDAEDQGVAVVKKFNDFSLYSDRIQGAAKTLVLQAESPLPALEIMGTFTQICKALGTIIGTYKISEGTYSVAVAIQQDSVDIIANILQQMAEQGTQVQVTSVDTAILDRLRWLGQVLKKELAGQGTHELELLFKKIL